MVGWSEPERNHVRRRLAVISFRSSTIQRRCYTSNHWRSGVRIARIVLGVLLVLIGVVWFLQGINVLPGSFMTGQTRWAVYGGIAVVAGVGLLWTAKRRPLP